MNLQSESGMYCFLQTPTQLLRKNKSVFKKMGTSLSLIFNIQVHLILRSTTGGCWKTLCIMILIVPKDHPVSVLTFNDIPHYDSLLASTSLQSLLLSCHGTVCCAWNLNGQPVLVGARKEGCWVCASLPPLLIS